MVKRLVVTVLAGLFATACAEPPPSVDKRAVLSHTLATSAQVFTQREGGVQRAGSAVVLSSGRMDGQALFLTTAHTLQPPVEQKVSVVVSPQNTRVPAQIVAIDPERDLALLSADLVAQDQVDLAAGAELADEVFVVAFPWGRSRTVVNGAVSQISQKESLEDLLPIWGPVSLIDASVSYGMSGGGVYERKTGKLVGLVRGYRTAQLSLSSEKSPLKLPIAGETTVVSTRDITCFLRSLDVEIAAPYGLAADSLRHNCA